MNDRKIIYLDDAIDAVLKRDANCGIDSAEVLKNLPPAQLDLTYIIFETLAECGIHGEEATIKLIGTLKRLGRNDLLPPCVR